MKEKTIILETPRLLLQTWTEDDLESLYALYQHPDTLKFYHNKPLTLPQAQRLLNELIEHQKKHGFSLWACQLKLTQQIIGFAGFMTLEDNLGIDLGYHFTRLVWGQGFATETAKHCLNYGFNNLSFERVLAMTNPNNQASKRVLIKMGMIFQKQIIYKNKPFDLYQIDKNYPG